MRNAAFAALAAIVIVAGCSGPSSVQDARKKVDVFHSQFNAANYEAIWADSSEEVLSTTNKQAFLHLLTGIHNYYGDAKSTTQVGWHYDTNAKGSFSEVTMQTDFTKGRAYEVFIFRNIGDEQKLAGYNIGKDPPSPSPSASN
jgi:hypothetical protein